MMQCPRIELVDSVGGMPVAGWPIPGTDRRTEWCPTYTASLPEVQDAVDQYPQWKERTLTEFVEETPTPDTLRALAVLDHALSAHRAWDLDQRAKRGK